MAARKQGGTAQVEEPAPVATEAPAPEPAPVEVETPILLTPIQQRLANLRAKKAAEEQPVLAPTPESETAKDAPEFEQTELSADEQMLDRMINDLDIVDCYNWWSGKKHVNAGSKRESIMCSCPNPAHADKNPSAWMNRDKKTWYCSGCAEGGDLWDIAAWHFNYPVPQYKTDKKMFRDLRDSIATFMGYAKYTVAGKASYQKIEQPAPEVKEAPAVEEKLATVTQLHAVPDEEDPVEGPEFQVATLDWRPLVSEGTFLDEWMKVTRQDTAPEEFHFFTGLMAIGFAVGRNRVLADVPEVLPNINVCLVGKSGSGKSRAKRHLKEIVHLALPFDYQIPFPTGTKSMSPGSGEALVREFQHQIDDPTTPGKKFDCPVRGIIEFDEMVSLVAKGTRTGSSLKPMLMELFDGPRELGNSTITNGRVVAVQPFGQVITTTQNRSIRHVLTNNDDASGFVNRWTFVTGLPKPPKSINNLVLNFDTAAAKLKSIHHWASSKERLILAPDAFELFDDFILNKVLPAKDKSEEFSDIFNRMDLLLKKLLVLITCNEKELVIQKSSVEKMIGIYPYLLKVYGMVDASMAESLAGELAEAIASTINKYYDRHKKFPTAREIRQNLPPKMRDFELLNKTLKTMIDLGLIGKEETKPQRGPTTVRYGFAS